MSCRHWNEMKLISLNKDRYSKKSHGLCKDRRVLYYKRIKMDVRREGMYVYHITKIGFSVTLTQSFSYSGFHHFLKNV